MVAKHLIKTLHVGFSFNVSTICIYSSFKFIIRCWVCLCEYVYVEGRERERERERENERSVIMYYIALFASIDFNFPDPASSQLQ